MKRISEEKIVKILFIIAIIIVTSSVCLIQIFSALNKQDLSNIFKIVFLIGLSALLGVGAYSIQREIEIIKNNEDKNN